MFDTKPAPTTLSDHYFPPTQTQSDLLQFASWLAAALEIPVQTSQQQRQFRIPPAHRHAFADNEYHVPAGATLGSDSELVAGLLNQAHEAAENANRVLAAHPCQPVDVAELADVMLSQYETSEGEVRLASCTFKHRPFIRLSVIEGSQPGTVDHHLFTSDGTPVGETLDSVEFSDYVSDALSFEATPAELANQLELTREQFKLNSPNIPWNRIVASVVWLELVDGKIQVSANGTELHANFAGVAQLFKSGKLPAPPFTCPVSGESSRVVVATDDGRLTVPNGIAQCDQTGTQVMATEVCRCAETQQAVLPKYVRTCPNLGKTVLQTLMVTCMNCRQQVAPSTCVDEVCDACRSLRKILKDDPQLALILDEYPRLDRWSKWQLVETKETIVLLASSFWKRLLVVVDRHDLTVRQLAERGLLSRTWSLITPEQWPEYLD